MSFFANAQGFAIHNGSFTNVNYNFQGGIDRSDEHVQAREGGLDFLYQYAVQSSCHNAEQRFPPPNCFPGTRIQILDILRRWIRSGESKPTSVYWLYGPAGVGKSAVAQTICEEFVDCHLAASFFFARTDHARNNLSFFVLTIAHQLVTNPILGPLLVDYMITSKRDIIHATLEQQFQELIVDPCSQLPAERWSNLPRLIVVDGLDECIDIASQERLLSMISRTKAGSTPLPFEFLVCSRPEPRIRNAFSHRKFHAILDCNNIGDSFESGKDIARYLRHEFKRIRFEHGPAMEHVSSDWPGDGIIQQLVQRACGQFIYATTVLKYVGDYHFLPTERLEIILNITVPEEYDSPYPDLDWLYMQILSTCDQKELLIDVLAHLVRPHAELFFDTGCEGTSSFIIEELYFLAQGRLWTLLFGLHSVLFIPANRHDGLRILHASFIDFLTDPKRSGSYFVDRRDEAQHDRIARYLLKRIASAIENNLYIANSRFDHYAWNFWHLHCQKVHNSPSRKLLSALGEINLYGLINTALQRRSNSNPSLETCVIWLRKCLSNLEAIAQWADTQSQRRNHTSTLESLSKKFRVFKAGFQIEIPVGEKMSDLMVEASVFKYDYTLLRADMWDMISSIMKYRLNAMEVGRILSSSWSCPQILPLQDDHILCSSGISVESCSAALDKRHIDPSKNSKTICVNFVDCNREIVLHCLQTLQESSRYSHEAALYASSQWIHHLSATPPSENMLQLVWRNTSLLLTSGDVKQAITWLEDARGCPSQAKVTQHLAKLRQTLLDVEEGRKASNKKHRLSKLFTGFRLLHRRSIDSAA